MPSSNDYYGNTTHDGPSSLQYEQQMEEERLRDDILRYLIKNSNGAFHFATELRRITRDVVGIRVATRHEFEQTEISLLHLLSSDPQRRFTVVGEGDNIFVKRAALDKDVISTLVEEWRCLIADFLLESKRNICLSDIGSSVPRPVRIPSSVKLIIIMKTDPLNRFILQGDGNSAKVKYNMHTDPDQESLWIAKWKDDIFILLSRSLSRTAESGQSIAILEIEARIERPFFLHPDVHLRDVLAQDPFQRFVILGSGIDTHVTIRNFRGDEPEILEYVEHWRLLIADYLITKGAIQGVVGSHPLIGYGLSQVGAYVPRPLGVPASVKLVDVMRGDPISRFIMSGEGNALRAMMVDTLNEGRIGENMYFQNIDNDQDDKNRVSETNGESHEFGRSSQNTVNAVNQNNQELTVAQKQLQIINAHSEWKARLGNPRVNQKQKQQITNQKQGIHGSRNNGYNMTREYLTDIGRENVDQRRSMNDPHDNGDQRRFKNDPHDSQRMIGHGRPPIREPYQDRDDKSSYEGQKLFNFSTQQQFNHSITSLSGNNDFTEDEYTDDIPLDWNSLSQRDYTSDKKKDLHHSPVISSQPFLNFHRDSEFSNSNAEKFRLKSNNNDDKCVEQSNDLGFIRKGSIVNDHDNDFSLSDYTSSNTNDSGGMGPFFGGLGGFDSSSSRLLNNDVYVNHQNELNMSGSQIFPLNQHENNDKLSSTSIPLDKWTIKAWLPIAFDGFDKTLINTFISKLRDDGGFVTVQDLLDYQSKGELTREALADIAGFKVGHWNRFEKTLAPYKEVKSDL